MQDKMYNTLKKIRGIGIGVSILLIILGIAMFVRPLVTALVVSYIFIIAIIVSGIFGIVKYVKTPDKSSQTWSLIFGILSAVLGIYIFIKDISGGVMGDANAIYMMSMVLAFMLITSGIGKFTGYSALKKAGKAPSGWMIASAVIDILAAIFFMMNPITMLATYEWIMGIYVVIIGVSLLIELLSDPKPEKNQ